MGFWSCGGKTLGRQILPPGRDRVNQPFSLNWGKWVNCLSQTSIFSIVRSDWLKATVSYNSRPILSIPTLKGFEKTCSDHCFQDICHVRYQNSVSHIKVRIKHVQTKYLIHKIMHSHSFLWKSDWL